MSLVRPTLLAAAGIIALAGLTFHPPATSSPCAPDNGGLMLPEGFCAVVVARDLGPVRHLAVAPNGDLFAAVRNGRSPGYVVALRDRDGDGVADSVVRFGSTGGTGIGFHGSHLYFAPDDRVLRWPWRAGQMVPEGAPEVMVQGLPTGGHTAKSMAFGGGDSLFVTIGSRTNSCQRRDRQDRSPGVDPCTELDTRAGVWRFSATRHDQRAADGVRYATGLRNPLALAVDSGSGLYAVVHGRDQLGQNWGYSDEANAEKPAEEFVRLTPGSDFGWPYCYYDPVLSRKVLAPEYGGDGTAVGRCASMANPLLAFPAHWAPNALVFYHGASFPARYRGGAFIAFHGSWNRAPLPQAGYRVVFVPMEHGRPSGTYETFAVNRVDPVGLRPAGLAVGPDGSLYIGDDRAGTIWRIFRRP